MARAALSQYRGTAGVPLGADLFGFSWQDIRQTLGAARLDLRSTLSLLAVIAMAGWAISIFPSDPDTGKRIGEGQFKLPLGNTL